MTTSKLTSHAKWPSSFDYDEVKCIFDVCKTGDFQTLRQLICETRVNFQWEISSGFTPLMYLIWHNCQHPERLNELLELMKWIFARVGDWIINIQTISCITTLNSAIHQRSIQCLRLLLKHGGDPTIGACKMWIVGARHKVKHNTGYYTSSQIVALMPILTTMEKAALWWHCPREWRPTLQFRFPCETRMCIRTLLILYHSQQQQRRNSTDTVSKYPQSALCYMPVEIFQYLMEWVCMAARQLT